MTAILAEMGQPSFRSRQVYEGATRGLAQSYDELTPLSRDLRAKLEAAEPLRELTTDEVQQSADGTIKLRLTTRDGYPVEAVAMRHRDRNTVCVSSQSGCPLKCTFCATGSMGLGRNLTQGEIVEQVLVLARMLRERGPPRHQRRDDGHGRAVPQLRRGARRLPHAERSPGLRPRRAPDRDLDRRLDPRHRAALRGADAGAARAVAARAQRRSAGRADAGEPSLPPGAADGRVPGLPGGHGPADLHRVPDARRASTTPTSTPPSSARCCGAGATTST